MFSKAIVFFMSFFVILAAAGGPCPTTTTVTATPTPTATSVSQCNAGGVARCCNTVGAANNLLPLLLSVPVGLITGLLNIVIDPINAIVGLGCTPISVVGGANVCSTNPVCCTNNDFDGIINIGCTNISLL